MGLLTGDFITIPTKSMRFLRNHKTPAICVSCKSGGSLQNMMICSKCKIAVYCSHEFIMQCQKRNWAIHKRECQQPKTPVSFKLVHTFLTDPFVSHVLRELLVASVGMDQQFTPNKIYIARCDLAIEPLLPVVRNLATGRRKVSEYPNGVDGMIHIRKVRGLDPSIFLDSGREKIWRYGRELALDRHWKEESSGKTLGIGLIDFHMDGTEQVITVPIPIDEEAVTKARERHSDLMSKGIRHPEASQSPMERYICYMVNCRIQDDEKNIMRLRTRLPQEALNKYVGIDLDQYAHGVSLLPPSTPGKGINFDTVYVWPSD